MCEHTTLEAVLSIFQSVHWYVGPSRWLVKTLLTWFYEHIQSTLVLQGSTARAHSQPRHARL